MRLTSFNHASVACFTKIYKTVSHLVSISIPRLFVYMREHVILKSGLLHHLFHIDLPHVDAESKVFLKDFNQHALPLLNKCL